MGTVVYYVSGHGLGHSARALGVCAALPASTRLVVRTSSPRWFWDGELSRPFEWMPQAFDAGAVQLDNLRSDGVASLTAAAEVRARCLAEGDAERRLLEEVGASVVVSDVPSFPLAVAAAAGIPSILTCNFTWVTIYRPYLDLLPPGRRAWGEALVDALEAEVRQATEVLVTPLAMDMPELARWAPIPLIVRPHADVGDALRRALDIPPGHRLVLISTGVYGLDLDWPRLGSLPGVSFVSFNVPPEARPYVKALSYPAWRSQDVCAAADAVVAKAGYGTIAECMASGTPLIHPPRPSFAEHEALVRGMAPWGGGVPISDARFRALDLGDALGEAFARRPLPQVDMGGAEAVGARIRALGG